MAILYDLYRSLPSSDTLKDVLRDSYHERGIRHAVERTIVEFEPSEIVGSNVTFAFDELSTRLEILVIDL